tara:strand:- start:6274 stop:7770 length:1497 start_codon:yes stop_codon:yes gene_type:complete
MRKNIYKISIIIIINLIIISCGNEQQFSSPTIAKIESACDHQYYLENKIQTKFSIVGPKVDFIFIWDNSTSMSNYTNNLLMKKVNESVNKISDTFDVHMLFAPLLKIGDENIDNGYYVADNNSGLDNSIKSKLILKENINSSISSFPKKLGSKERGFERSIELLNQNKDNGFLRKDAHTIIVLISTGEDTNTSQLVNNVATTMINIKNEMGNKRQFRFISIVPHKDKCFIPTTKKSSRYIELSKIIFNYFKDNSPKHGISTTDPYPDSFNACEDSQIIRSIATINETINIDDHIYQFWPIAPSSFELDPTKIDVKKVDTRSNKIIEIQESNLNGFKYIGKKDVLNIGEPPTEQNIENNHFIQLFSDAKVLYPDYLIVQTQSPKNLFGFVRLQFKPYLKNLYLEIDGKTVPRSKNDPNGWEVVCKGKVTNERCDSGPHEQEIQIDSPDDWPTYRLKGDKFLGYFLKLGRNVVYSNNSVIKVKYFPNSKAAEMPPGCLGP